MNTLDFARDQFAITTLFHFIFVPISIGLALFVVASARPAATSHRNEVYLRMTKFWGKFLLISMAIGVVTGIVQEFQFGMNWALYSKYVGDIFGAPLAMEGLIAFFLESTFIGLWIFGWGRLSPGHASVDDLADRRRHRAVGLLHPRGELVDAAPRGLHHQPRSLTRRSSTTSSRSCLNPTVLLAFPHMIFAASTTARCSSSRSARCSCCVAARATLSRSSR